MVRMKSEGDDEAGGEVALEGRRDVEADDAATAADTGSR